MQYLYVFYLLISKIHIGVIMVHNLTVAVEEDLWVEMKKHSEIRWSVVMKKAAREKLEALRLLENLTQKTRLSEEEIEKISVEIGRKVNRK